LMTEAMMPVPKTFCVVQYGSISSLTIQLWREHWDLRGSLWHIGLPCFRQVGSRIVEDSRASFFVDRRVDSIIARNGTSFFKSQMGSSGTRGIRLVSSHCGRAVVRCATWKESIGVIADRKKDGKKGQSQDKRD